MAIHAESGLWKPAQVEINSILLPAARMDVINRSYPYR